MNQQVLKIKNKTIKIHDEFYYLDFNDTNFSIEELVMDARDLRYGIIECISESYIVIRDECAKELVPLNEIVKLKKHHIDFILRN